MPDGIAQDCTGIDHNQRSRDTVIGYIPDNDRKPAVGKLVKVVKITPYSNGRLIMGGSLPMGYVRQLFGKECLLNPAGYLQFVIHSFPFHNFVLLLVDKLCYLQGRRSLAGEDIQQVAVVD